jgi:hypothetical protein
MVKYRSYLFRDLTSTRNPGEKQRLVGSLTGVVASQNVTEAFKGSLKTNRNRWLSVNAQESLTVRPTSRTGAKAGVSDLMVPHGRAITQWIKGTPGITG